MCCPAGAIPTIAIADSGVKMTAWPSALVTSGQNSCARRVVEVEIEASDCRSKTMLLGGHQQF
jgi:hypothetical protein